MSGPQLPGRPPTPSPARHPLLGLTPAARRELARTLVRDLAASRKQRRGETLATGGRGAAIVLGVGTALGAAWVGLGSGALAPFAVAYAALVGLQAATGGRLAAGTSRNRPGEPVPGWARAARAFALAPYDAATAAAAVLVPERVSPDRLVLAAGLLVAVRHPLSSNLLRRLVGRAYPLAEVDRAIDLLVRSGHLTYAPAAPGVLMLTPAGIALLKSLGVSPPIARQRRDPEIAAHLQPLFAALDARAPRGRVQRDATGDAATRPAEVTMRPPVAIIRPPDTPIRPPEAAPAQPATAPVPETKPPELAPIVDLPRPGRRTAPIALAPVVEPLAAPLDSDEEPAQQATRARWRRPGPLSLAAVAIAAAGLLLLLLPRPGVEGPRQQVLLTANLMPHSRGTAIQFNGRGSLLSSFGGDLFLSIPERLDYKKALSFQGFDMASDCGLIDPDIRTARVAPLGRFLWVESGGAGSDGGPGHTERDLVDFETKTITHDLPSRQPAYGLPHVIGWAGPQTLLMANQPPPIRTARWWSVDVGSHGAVPVDIPVHARVLPLATEGGPALIAGFDDHTGGSWDLTTYWLAEGRAFQKIRTLRMTLPEGLKDSAPHHAALSPDKRYLLVAVRSASGLPATTGSLMVVSLEDGQTTRLDVSADPLVDQPIFWAPGVQDGHYRFYFNGDGPDGVVPLAGEMRVEPRP